MGEITLRFKLGRDRQRVAAQLLLDAMRNARPPMSTVEMGTVAIEFGGALEVFCKSLPVPYLRELSADPIWSDLNLRGSVDGMWPSSGPGLVIEPFRVPVLDIADTYMSHSRQKTMAWSLLTALHETYLGQEAPEGRVDDMVMRVAAGIEGVNGADPHVFRSAIGQWEPPER